MPLRLTWFRTWPDEPEDLSCWDGHQRVGRIYRDNAPGGEGERWRWTVNGYLPEHKVWLSESGFAASKQEAAEAVEAAYLKAKERPANGR